MWVEIVCRASHELKHCEMPDAATAVCCLLLLSVVPLMVGCLSKTETRTRSLSPLLFAIVQLNLQPPPHPSTVKMLTFPMRFFLLLSLLAAAVLSAPIIPPTREPSLGTTDHRMMMDANRIQLIRHYPSETPRKVHAFHPGPIQHFQSRALELTQTHGARHVGVDTDTMGRRTNYFYSVIHGDDQLGREMGLHPDHVAGVLWKYVGEGAQYSEPVHVQAWYNKPGVKWELDDFMRMVERYH